MPFLGRYRNSAKTRTPAAPWITRRSRSLASATSDEQESTKHFFRLPVLSSVSKAERLCKTRLVGRHVAAAAHVALLSLLGALVNRGPAVDGVGQAGVVVHLLVGREVAAARTPRQTTG